MKILLIGEYSNLHNSLKKGLHVFCEKPPGMNVEEIKEVIKITKKITKKLH